MASVKVRRLEGIIRKNISEIVQFDVKDPNVGFVTITDVRISNDHSYATVYCVFLGKEERAAAGLKALNRAKGHIRSVLSQRLSIRRVPELNFVIDKAMENGRHIEEIIREIHAHDDEKPVAEEQADEE